MLVKQTAKHSTQFSYTEFPGKNMKNVKVGQIVWYITGTAIATGTVSNVDNSRVSIESTTMMSNGTEQIKAPQAYEADFNDVFSSYHGASVALGRRLHGRK